MGTSVPYNRSHRSVNIFTRTLTEKYDSVTNLHFIYKDEYRESYDRCRWWHKTKHFLNSTFGEYEVQIQ